MTTQIQDTAGPPLIGITIGPERDQSDYLRLRATYVHAVAEAGGLPVLIPPLPQATLEALLERLDGVVFPGGADVEPRHYHAERQPETQTVPQLDDHELAVAHWVTQRELPTLGICRGQQLLNVALGGTLVQHLPDHPHSTAANRAEAVHQLQVAPTSRLAALLGTTQAEVNSLHHQAVDHVAPSLQAVAWAADGTIEGLETRAPGWLVAVQFHPEDMLGTHEPSRRLFAALVAAAQAHRARALPPRVAALR